MNLQVQPYIHDLKICSIRSYKLCKSLYWLKFKEKKYLSWMNCKFSIQTARFLCILCESVFCFCLHVYIHEHFYRPINHLTAEHCFSVKARFVFIAFDLCKVRFGRTANEARSHDFDLFLSLVVLSWVLAF